MPYSIDRTFVTGNRFPLIVNDKTVDTSATSISILGKGIKNYGEFLMENLLHMLENFASTQPPINPLEGQIWYDLAEDKPKVFSKEARWVSINRVSTTEPTQPGNGDLWFDLSRGTLFSYNSATQQWMSIGAIRGNLAPSKPRDGDLWYDTNERELKVWDASISKWRTASGPEYIQSDISPGFEGHQNGDIWYNPVTKVTQIWTGTQWDNIIELYSQSIAPSNPVEGTVWWDSDDRILYVFNETQGWIRVSTNEFTIGPNPPSDPNEGELWWRQDANRLFVRDQTNGEWILIGPNLRTQRTPPANNSNSDLWYNPDEGILYVWDTSVGVSGIWQAVNPPEGFTDLTDTPSDYTAAAGRYVRVNPEENGLFFDEPPTPSFLQLTDTPSNYVNRANNVLTVNQDENSLAFVSADQFMPTGAILPFGGSVAPSGWLLCDGSPVSRQSFNALFTVLSDTYGPGDGSTTFNLPDMRGRVAVGSGLGTGLTTRPLGVAGGSEDYLTTTSGAHSHINNPSGLHDHTITVVDGGDHTHGITVDGHALTAAQIPTHTHDTPNPIVTVETGTGTQGFGAGSDTFITETSTGSVGADEEHTHTASSATAGMHDHTATSTTEGEHSHAMDSAGEHSHNTSVMQPFLAINYIIKV